MSIENLTQNEAYTHYSVDGSNVTVARAPNEKLLVMIRTRQDRNKITGSSSLVEPLGPNGDPTETTLSPYYSYLCGSKDNLKTYFSSKKLAEKMLPSWTERVINDHLRYFY